ncbi:amino acid ABC transporter ATP-binding protein [Cetobacterium sp. 8H]|uniref:amino acid ABC transporter ATP-binding protein n=1 Tax=Cetobacterium sp. 8H TaxID=2759681 RepID=UPI00163BAD96|nr:amino acid ABC transporter ATP-binding protein [Cetobacterium sp. 8H]MBC2850962.1 amino acid ABC transporter ATP-binding protein [Cetobacterium sp. 8H]
MEIKIKDLCKRFGEQVVLNSLDLELEKIHSLVIIGPSGGGKSTLLRILAGLEIPESGSIIINGEQIPKIEEELHEYRKGVGIVFQAFNLFPHLTALKNIMLPLEKVQKVEHKIAKERAIGLLKRFDLYEHKDKYPHQLSGGQQQRVAIVRALALEPKFLLLDEPTSALDPALTKEILEAILELRKDKKDMVLVTHEMSFAKDVADCVIFVSGGKIVEMGPPGIVFDKPMTFELCEFLGGKDCKKS